MTTSSIPGDLEKHNIAASGLKSDDHISRHVPGHQHHTARLRERLRHFLHPNGKRILAAASPEEADQLQKRLGEIHQDHEFDVYISGTSEHLDALREAQSHHEDRRESLRMQHQEVYDRFADIHNELDALASELDRVTSHGVALEAHFNRFGYNSHVRSYDDESPSASGSVTPHSSMHEKQQFPCERGFATPLRLFKIPTLRQYFHHGILWRSAGSEEVQSFELFVDLLYVGILQINGDITSEDPTGLSLLHFVVTFILSYKIWNDMSLFISWFETDDVFQRVSILFLLACLFGYTTFIRAEHLGDHMPVGICWFYCGGFGLALLFMALISISHIHREQEGRVRVTKKFRLIFRISVAIILICLPLAHSLDSLDLIGTVTGLLVLLLCLELWAASNVHDKLFGRTTTCQYFGNCGKKDLRAMLQDGKEVDMDLLTKDEEKNSGCTVVP